MIRARMNGYYPQIITAIEDFQAIIDAEYPEFEELHEATSLVIDNAYLWTMREDRIEQWEQVFGIKPLANSTVQDRRDTIIARIRGQGKLNTALISNIVNAFTGGTAMSYIEDSVLYVIITPPKDNKEYQFLNVEQELAKKVPAHLGLQVSRNYYTWREIKDTYDTWQDVKDNLETWYEVWLFVPFED